MSGRYRPTGSRSGGSAHCSAPWRSGSASLSCSARRESCLPVAIWLAVRWALFAQVVELEEVGRVSALRRSARLVRRRWFRVASLVGVGAALALAAGPLVGAALIVLTDAPLPLLNVVAGIIYAVALPFVALTTSYVYFDSRTRFELQSAEHVDELPAEIVVSDQRA